MHYSTQTAVNMHLIDRWASLLGGITLTTSVLRRKPVGKAIGLLLGAELVRRGLTGHSYGYQVFGVRTRREEEGANISVPYELGVRARAAVTITKPRADVYRFWRNFENLPRIMKHLISVEGDSSGRMRWVAEGPRGSRLKWEAQIHNDIENELIAWRSLPGGDVDSAGSVRFKDAPGGRGTEVLVHLQYNPPAGLVGATIAKLFGGDAETEIESDLLRLKQYMETGEMATTEAQPKGPSFSRRRLAPAPPGRSMEARYRTRQEEVA